jgi:AcrR family transcriptional regulator
VASKRETNKEKKRQAILDAAAKEFSLKSYYGTNCAQIASSAGVAVGTIYEHFVDKQDVANKLYQRAYERYLDNFLHEVHESESAEAQFRQAWHAFYRVLETNRDEFLFTELQFHESYLDDTSRRVRNMVRSVFGAWIQRLIDSKQVRISQVETAFSLLIGSFTRQVKNRLESNTPMTKGFLDELIDSTWNCLKK